MALVIGEVVGQIEPRPADRETRTSDAHQDEAPRPPIEDKHRALVEQLERRRRRLEVD